MKTNLKTINITLALVWAICIVMLLLLSSCRTAKKTWVSENYASKTQLDSATTKTYTSLSTDVSALSQTFNAKYSDFLQKLREKDSRSENESTTVSGTITAEDGKEKSVTVGGTTITSNGANVTFETNFTKALSREFESYKENTEQTIENILEENSILEKRLDKSESEQLKLQKQIDELKNKEETTTTKRGLTFWAVFGLVVLIAGYFAVKKIR